MTLIVALDASPVSLLTQRKGVADADACRAWAESMVAAGASLVLPGIADYEVRRELLRAGKAAGIARLDALRASPAVQYLPVSDSAMLRAALLWAEARRRGLPTADPAELDCDVVLVAIVLAAGFPPDQVVIATSNVGHLSRFLRADNWRNIRA
jgi:predicted nucleic acid-binding protein